MSWLPNDFVVEHRVHTLHSYFELSYGFGGSSGFPCTRSPILFSVLGTTQLRSQSLAEAGSFQGAGTYG